MMVAVLSTQAEKLFRWLSEQDATEVGRSSLAPWQIPFQEWGVNDLSAQQALAEELQRFAESQECGCVRTRPAGHEFMLEFDNTVRRLWHQYQQQRGPVAGMPTMCPVCSKTPLRTMYVTQCPSCGYTKSVPADA